MWTPIGESFKANKRKMAPLPRRNGEEGPTRGRRAVAWRVSGSHLQPRFAD